MSSLNLKNSEKHKEENKHHMHDNLFTGKKKITPVTSQNSEADRMSLE